MFNDSDGLVRYQVGDILVWQAIDKDEEIDKDNHIWCRRDPEGTREGEFEHVYGAAGKKDSFYGRRLCDTGDIKITITQIINSSNRQDLRYRFKFI